MPNQPIKLDYTKTIDYMSLLAQNMVTNKIRFNELKNTTNELYEGREWSMTYLKETNQRYRDTWFKLNTDLGKANNCIEIFNATKQREINSNLCK